MNKQVVLVVGCGSIGSRHARLLQEMGHIVWCADRDFAISGKLAQSLGGSAVVVATDGPIIALADAVFICTWPDSHLFYARQSIGSGVPTFIEKPLGLSLDGWEDLADLACRQNVKTMVACNWRFHPDLPTRAGRVEFWIRPSPSSEHYAGPRLDVGSHAEDLARYLGANWEGGYTDGEEVRRVDGRNLVVTDEMYRRQFVHFFTESSPMNPLSEAIQTLRALL